MIIIIIWFGDSVTVTHLTKGALVISMCSGNSSKTEIRHDDNSGHWNIFDRRHREYAPVLDEPVWLAVFSSVPHKEDPVIQVGVG